MARNCPGSGTGPPPIPSTPRRQTINPCNKVALGLTSAHKLRSAECYCSRATLDDLLSDAVMALVLRSAGYEPDEFREMMTEMAWNLVAP